MRLTAASALLLVLAVATPAHAIFMPLNGIDDTWFPATVEDVQLMAIDLSARRSPSDAIEGTGPRWIIDAELRIRNHNPEPRPLDAAVVDTADTTDETAVFVRGVPVESEVIDPGHDPAHTELVFDHARHIHVDMEPYELISVRISMVVEPEVDALGQVFLRLPTEVLGLFEGAVPAAFIEVTLDQRPVGMQASLTGYTLYDEPENRITWYVLDWEPTRPLEVAYLPSWSALLLVANVEQCPEPFQVVQHMTGGDIPGLRTYLDGFDLSTLEFCAALPLMIHGYVFDSNRVREQFAAIPLTRYVPGERNGASIYVENPIFQTDMLGDVEALYRRTLTQFGEGG